MPLYVYECKNAHLTDIIRPVEERHTPTLCEKCFQPATLVVQTAAFDPKMGLDAGFPTAYERWAKTHARAARGK